MESVSTSDNYVLQLMNSTHLYNLLQDTARSKLIVDVRNINSFEESCIRNSIHISFDKEPVDAKDLQNAKCERLAWDEQPVACKIKDTKDWNYRGLMYKYIVLYDSDGTDAMCHALYKLLLAERKVDVANLFLLDGGFKAFYLTYPFMCSSKVRLSKAIDGAFPTEVMPSFLYLGSFENASNRKALNELGITHILNMADELQNQFPDEFLYKQCGVNDTAKDNIASFFSAALAFIDSARASPSQKVLVHCAMGISRSSAIVIAWLMKHNTWTFEQAKAFVRSHRSIIKPNEGFVVQLMEFEKQLFNRDSK